MSRIDISQNILQEKCSGRGAFDSRFLVTYVFPCSALDFELFLEFFGLFLGRLELVLDGSHFLLEHIEQGGSACLV